MTKQEMNNKISELEKQIAELKEQLNKKDNKMPVGEIWKPEEKERYYYYDIREDIVQQYLNEFDNVDNWFIENALCYPTKEKAKFEAQREKYTRLFKQYVEQHSEPLDWENEAQFKYYVHYVHNKENKENKRIAFWQSCICQSMGTIYASSEQVLQEAIDFVGEENVKKYILEIKE